MINKLNSFVQKPKLAFRKQIERQDENQNRTNIEEIFWVTAPERIRNVHWPTVIAIICLIFEMN